MIAFRSFSNRIHNYLQLTLTIIFILGILWSVNPQTAFALSVPQPIYPGDGLETTPATDPPLGVPSFSWTNVESATKYRLQVDSEIGFNSPIFLNITTTNTTFTPAQISQLFSDGDWYWRVRVEAPSPVGEWSDIIQFTKTWATLENSPKDLTPPDGTTLAFLNENQFSWSPVMGAARYRFQIAASPDGFSSPILSSDTITTTYQTNTFLENGTYYWRVIPLDAASHFGTISDILSVTMAYGTEISPTMTLIPTLLTPEDESYPIFTPTFHWTAVEGAQLYRLEYTTEQSCDFSVGTTISTRQTYYDPTETFPNDVDYCWHVRVESNNAVGDWSETWHFQKQWYLQPELLTPTNLYQNGLYPVYSWTPVAGASQYRIDISLNSGFNPIYESFVTANTTYSPQAKYDGSAYYYWRVTPIDGSGKLGLTSEVAEYNSNYDSLAPILVYPLYYYDPVSAGENETFNPTENRTVAYPIFMWHRVMVPTPTGGVFATAYRIQVDTTPYFTNIVWQYDTENTSATPTSENDFDPLTDQDYYWRVCVLNTVGGSCISGATGGWSQIWKTRFNPDYGQPDNPNPWALPPTTGDAPVLLRPAHGQESVEATPLLEWFPMQDMIQYQVVVSRDSTFSANEIDATVNLPAYSPNVSLAQRLLNRLDYGTFYWHVRGFDGSQWTEWSAVRRFQIASQSEWRYLRTLGDSANRLEIGNDPSGDAVPAYDLEKIYATQQGGNPPQSIPAYWYLGFSANLASIDMTYVFYVDLDHLDSSGASFPPPAPRNYSVTTIPAHQPEYAIYIDKISGSVSADNTWVYAWNGSSWDYGQRLSDIGGQIYSAANYVELQLPNASIGMSQVTGSASVILFSVNPSTNQPIDSVPSDPQIPGSGQLSRFTAVSERMNLVFTPNRNSNSGEDDPRTLASILPFYWDWPTGSYPSTPFAGGKVEVHLDPAYTNLVEDFTFNSTDSYFGENNITFLADLIGDNIYYWRVQPKYKLPEFSQAAFSAWTSGWSFRRLGFTAKNLQSSVNWATPTFSWDMAEGARTYHLQVSSDPNFGSTVINVTTPLTSYTPTSTLVQGIYYWRVLINRFGGIENDWSDVQQFELTLPSPVNLTPNGDIVHYAPTFCWDPLIKYNDQEPHEPILTAWKYRLQVSRDENFSTIYDVVELNHTCWTPSKGYADGMYYWHVAMIDGNGKLGPYSTPAATFTKQYPITTLISPIGEPVTYTPTFIWTPVNGAATYRFEVSKFPTFEPLYNSETTINTHYTPVTEYDQNVIYYWRVAIKDRDGNQGPFTDSTIIIGPGSRTYLPVVRK